MAAEIIEDVTGSEDVNTDTYSNKKYVAIADGNDIVVEIPKSGDDAVVMDDGEDDVVSMQLPEIVVDERGVLTDDGTVVYTNEEESITIGVQPLKEIKDEVFLEGVRTTITISDSSASKEYEFAYDLQEGSKLVTAADYLGEEYDTGEVYIVDQDNVITKIIEPAWAKDANGNDIETYYKVNGNVLIQVVNFDENTAFPVVADPTAWQVTKCVAAIGGVIATTVYAGAKVVKIKKYIKELGGIKVTAELLMGALIKQDIKAAAKAGGEALVGLCNMVLGIDTIISNCKY